MRVIRTALPVIMAAAFCFIVIGCVSPSGQQRAQATTTEMVSYRDQAAQLHKSVDQNMEALNRIVADRQTNPRPHYDQFSKGLTEMESQLARTGQCAKRMNSKGDAYFRAWELELVTIGNPEIRKRSETRRTEVMSAYAKVDATQQAQKDAVEKLLSDLRDLHKCLRNDLTPLGIGSVTDLIEKTSIEAKQVKAKIDAATQEVDAMCASLNVPGTSQPAPTPAPAPTPKPVP